MPFIVIYNEDDNILFQNIMSDAQELMKSVCEGKSLPGFPDSTPTVQVNGMFIITAQTPKPKREVPELTDKQREVLRHLANSHPPEQIAKEMNLSLESIRTYIKILKKKFNTRSRDQLMARAGWLGLCDPF